MTQHALIQSTSEHNGSAAALSAPLRELEAGQQVERVFGVRERDLRQRRNGEPFLRLILCDSSGSLEAIAWDEAEARYGLAEPGSAVHVSGVFEVSERW